MPHIHESIDFVVNAFIEHDGKVLLILHKKLKKWLSVGGHIELDEDPEEALYREVKEESGLDIEVVGSKKEKLERTKSLLVPAFMDIHNVTDTHRHIALNYLAKAKSADFVFNAEEHDDIRWFTRNDLVNPKYRLEPAVKFYAKKALDV